MPLFHMSKQLMNEKSFPQVRLLEILPEISGQRLDNFLFRECKGVPKSHIYRAIRSGQVRVNRRRVKNDYRLQAGDLLRIPPMQQAERGSAIPVPAAEFEVIYEDNYFLALNKPAGVAVHGGSGVSFGVIEQLRAARPNEPFLELVHRLDRDTSGLLLVARRRRGLLALHECFRAGTIDKFYLALVFGDWVNERQHLRAPLQRWTTQSGERRVRVDTQGRAAHTVINLQQRFGAYSLLQAELRTGRTHQIRVHLAHQGHPIVGDDKYSSDAMQRQARQELGFKGMFLHAAALRFEHPVDGRLIELQAPLPADCQAVLQRLGA